MTTLRTAAQQALEALEFMEAYLATEQQAKSKAITALRAALAEPVQEPVAWVECDGDLVWNNREAAIGRNLYISPPPQQTEPSQDTPPQHEYEVTANDDGTFSVALPDGEELRIIPPQRPAEPVQEPVAWMVYTEGGTSAYVTDNPNDLVGAYRALPLYTSPPQRKPLTEKDIDSIWDSEKAFADIYAIARAIERAHGIV